VITAGCVLRSLEPRVSVVKASHAGQSSYLGSLRGLFLGSAAFRSVPNRGMDALRVVVLDLLAEQPSQVVFGQHDHVIEKFATNRSHRALSSPILPGTLERRSLRIDSKSRDSEGDLS
jgi:hypothetical protein